MKDFRILAALIGSLCLAACGGGASSSPDNASEPLSTTGTVGLLLTDKPSDDFLEINIRVVEAILIGGDGSQQSLFQGAKEVNLLDLTNYNEPVIFGEVPADTYTKLRLNIDALELVPHDGSDPIYPALPANGKIDLLDANGFEILPGRTVIIEIDMDANKSIKVTGTGNGRRYNFRPVVKVEIMDGGLPDKLARLEGVVKEIPADPAGSFVLCAAEMADNCIDISTDAETTSIFDQDGLETGFATLMPNDPVVVIGRYIIEPDILLDAIVLEIGGTAEQVSGNVVSEPMDMTFLMVIDGNGDIVVEQQEKTRYFDATGEILPDAVVLGADLEVEGVRPAKIDATDPDLIRAALVFVEAEDDEQLSGAIIAPLDKVARSFGLSPTAGSDTCVRVDADADILLVDTAASEAKTGTIDDLAVDQMVDLFGVTATDSCFDANEVIVEVVATP